MTPALNRDAVRKLQHAQYLRPLLVFMGIVGGFLVLATVLSGPIRLRVSILARCEAFTLPVPMSLDARSDETVRFYWYSLDIGDENGSSSRRFSPTVIDAASPPSIILTPGQGEAALFRFQIDHGVELAIKGQGARQVLELSHQHGGSVIGTADVLNANVETTHLASASRSPSKVEIRNQTTPSHIVIRSIQPPDPQLPAYAAIPLTPGTSSQPDFSKGMEIKRWSARGCQSLQTLRASSPEMIGGFSGQGSSLEVGWSQHESLGVDIPAEGQGLRIRSQGTVRSIRENDREILPTTLDELANRGSQQKGILGVLAATIVLAAGVFLKRALDILAKLVLPDQKE